MRDGTTTTNPAIDALADELLAVRCQLGEAAGFDALIERWHQPVWQYVRRLVEDDEAAADTSQDVWLRVVRALPGLRDPSRLRAWLFGIARRAVMDRLRRRYAEPELTSLDAVDGTETDDDLPEVTDEDLGRMHDALARLPLTERDVLVLFYLQELTVSQLADVLDVPVGTVKSRLFRARQLLRRELTQSTTHP